MGNKILVVDDATFMRMMIRDILTGNGYEIVAEAADGNEAVARYKALKPDLVLMDITMPEMDGIRAVKEIIREDPDAKIIMCSAMGQQAMVIQSIQSGALDFVVKPFHPDRVIDAVNRVLRYSSVR
jgi:two-component system chemotaxis response regulator CheY